MIKVVLWDIDGTLLNFEEAEKNAIRTCFRDVGFGECSDEMLKEYSDINRVYWQKLERGEMSKPEILVNRFVDFFSMYDLDVTKAEIFNKMYQNRLGDTIVFYPYAKEIVNEIKGHALQCVVTNGTKVAQDKKLFKSGLSSIFDHIFISEVIGFEKPNIKFFEEVFNKIGHYKKSEIIIVGDSLTSDMRGGVNADILTCWFNPEHKENSTDIKTDYEITNLKELEHVILNK